LFEYPKVPKTRAKPFTKLSSESPEHPILSNFDSRSKKRAARREIPDAQAAVGEDVAVEDVAVEDVAVEVAVEVEVEEKVSMRDIRSDNKTKRQLIRMAMGRAFPEFEAKADLTYRHHLCVPYGHSNPGQIEKCLLEMSLQQLRAYLKDVARCKTRRQIAAQKAPAQTVIVDIDVDAEVEITPAYFEMRSLGH
jgi:hypothetical protein